MIYLKTSLWGSCLLLGFSCFAQNLSFNPINDSTVARYRYETLERSYAEIPMGTNIEDIALTERDYLKPEKHHFHSCSGINSQNEPYFQTKNIESTTLEDWMAAPSLHLISPSRSFGYDSLGALTFQFDHNQAELTTTQNITTANTSDGWQPVMMFFPSKHDDFVQEAINSGAHFEALNNNSFKLTYAGHEMRVVPNDRRIEMLYSEGNTLYQVINEYRLYAPYGYVPTLELTRETRLDLDHPITLVRVSTFKNHVIEDFGNKVKKYTDIAHLEVFPNPLEGDYEVLLKGIPEAIVSEVQIRDYLGNVVFRHLNPNVEQDIISLNSASYPAGPLIIMVYTQHGIYSETLTKL